MQNTTQNTTIYSKSAMLAMKAQVNDESVSGITMMEAAKVARALGMKSPKKTNYVEEDELSTTASSGNESYGTTKPKKVTNPDGKMDKWMMAQIWGLAAGCLMAAGFSLLACAAAAMAIVLICTRKEVAAPAQKTSPWAVGPRSGAAPAKKSLRPYAPATAGQRQRNAATSATPQKTVILPPRPAAASQLRADATPFKMPTTAASAGPKITSSPAPTPGCTAELQKMLATPSTPVVTAAMRAQKQALNVRTPVKSPPGLAAPKVETKSAPVVYTASTFRRELVTIMKELAQTRNAAVAVGQVRSQGVPQDRQSAEFADILTRAMEERNGPVRRTYVAFAAGLAAGGEGSAFHIDECVKGTGVFFSEVYDELRTEVSRLDKIVECELVPTLRAVLSSEIVKTVLPPGMM